jgi:MFS family permease
MTMPTVPAAEDVAATPADPTAPAKVRLTPALKRFFGVAVPMYLSIYLIIGAVPGVLLPLQVAAIDDANKAANLALITGIGALVAMIVSPIAGLISDRTRSRFGRRAPWLVLGALATGLALVGMGLANGIAQLVIAWAIVQLTLNLIISPLSALMPDRVPAERRGLFSAIIGFAMMAGAIGGQAVGAAFSQNIPAAYLVLPGVMLIMVVLFVIFAPDASSKDAPREKFSLKVFLATFWVSPRKHPDFAWGFLGRFLLFAGYFAINGYQLYLLQDYIGLGSKAVGYVAILGLTSLVGMLVATAIAGPLSDKLGRRKIFVIAASLIMALAMVIPLVLPTLVGMILFSFICGLGFGAYMAVDSVLMSMVLPSSDSYSKDLGVLNIAATLPQTIAPFMGGMIVLAFGYLGLFPVGIVLAVLGALAIVPIKSVR